MSNYKSIPTKIRKVVYRHFLRPSFRSEFKQFVKETTGQEVVAEIRLPQEIADEYLKTNPPVVVGEKIVEVIVEKPKPSKYDDLDGSDDWKPSVD